MGQRSTFFRAIILPLDRKTNKLGKLVFVLHRTSNLFPTSGVRFMFVYYGEKVIHQANTLHIQGDDLLGLSAG